MKRSVVNTSIGIFILIVVGMGVYTYIKKQEMAELPQSVSVDNASVEEKSIDDQVFPVIGESDIAVSEPINEPLEVDTDVVYIEKVFTDGVHQINGEVIVPTPCHTLTLETQVAESYPEQVLLQLTTRSGDEMCAQVLSTATFSTSVNASSEATLSAIVDGTPASLQMIEKL